jgi:hypothetical protein
MALFPLIKPTTCDTAYFGGIGIIMCTWSDIKCPSSNPALLLLRRLAEHITKILAQLHIQRLPTTFWNENNVVFALPLGVI